MIDDLIIEGIETAGPSATIESLAMRMEQAGIGSIVIEEEMKPVGIVTDRDIALRGDARDRDPSEATAADVMTPDPAVVTNDAGLLDVTRVMRDRAVRRLPVVDDAGTLVGIITLDDCLRVLGRELDNLTQVVEAETPAY